MIQMEMVNTINNAEKVANMADSLNLIGPAGRRLYGAVKGTPFELLKGISYNLYRII